MSEPILASEDEIAEAGESQPTIPAEVDNEFSAYLVTFAFGPQDKATCEGKLYAVAGAYRMFNDGENGETNMYFMLPTDHLDDGQGGKWVREIVLMHEAEGWVMIPRPVVNAG